MRDRASDLRAIADGRLMLNVRNGVTVSRSMLARIADEFEAMSTAIAAKDAELAEVKGENEQLRLARPYDGWLYFNPDTGTEWAEQHPVESGEVPDAQSIRPATATNFQNELILAWEDLAKEKTLRARAEAQLAEARKALEPFAMVAEHDISEDEADSDPFRPMPKPFNHAPQITVGHIRAARRALAVVKEYLTARRPTERAVTDEMVEAAVQAVRQYTHETLFIDEHRELVRAALKAVMEAEG